VSGGIESGVPRRAAHLVLVGLPGAGKSTVGPLLARLLQRPFVDLDELIVERAGMPIPRIFRERGEDYFRRLEEEATTELVSQPESVIAPGGGWIENPDNIHVIRPPSRIVYLLVSAGRALARMRDLTAERPLLAGPDPETALQSLFERRHPLYTIADFQVDTEVLTPQEVANTIVRLASERGIRIG